MMPHPSGGTLLPTLARSTSNELTPREIQIAMLAGKWAMRNREIAEVMGISEQDVKNRLRRVFDKLGVWSRTELAMLIVNRDPVWAGKG
jgi:DNA-binding NarL/FixJ family response regulator